MEWEPGILDSEIVYEWPLWAKMTVVAFDENCATLKETVSFVCWEYEQEFLQCQLY